jgi:hypothetical protein
LKLFIAVQNSWRQKYVLQSDKGFAWRVNVDSTHFIGVRKHVKYLSDMFEPCSYSGTVMMTFSTAERHLEEK